MPCVCLEWRPLWTFMGKSNRLGDFVDACCGLRLRCPFPSIGLEVPVSHENVCPCLSQLSFEDLGQQT